MDSIIKALQQHPELAVFLTLALGYLLGRVKLGSFAIGSVTGVLIAGVLIGQATIVISPNVKAVFFLLFLFAIGYKVGPQFFGGLRKNGLPQAVLTLVLCFTALFTTFAAAKLMGYNIGTTAGLMGGAMTESAVLGTAGDAINRLAVADADQGRSAGQDGDCLCGHLSARHDQHRVVPAGHRPEVDAGEL